MVLRFLKEYSLSTAMSVLNKCGDPWNDFIYQKQNDSYLSSAFDQQLALVAGSRHLLKNIRGNTKIFFKSESFRNFTVCALFQELCSDFCVKSIDVICSIVTILHLCRTFSAF